LLVCFRSSCERLSPSRYDLSPRFTRYTVDNSFVVGWVGKDVMKLFFNALVMMLSGIIVSSSAALAAAPLKPFFMPTSGPVCTHVTFSGGILPPPYSDIRVAFNKHKATKVKVGSIPAGSALIRAREPAIFTVVPSDATTGAVALRLTQKLTPLGGNGPTKAYLFPKPFIITGQSLALPNIGSFSANPTAVTYYNKQTNLSWSLGAGITDARLNGKELGTNLFGHYNYPSSQTVMPAADTPYTLLASRQCAVAQKSIVVSVTKPTQGGFVGDLQFTSAQTNNAVLKNAHDNCQATVAGNDGTGAYVANFTCGSIVGPSQSFANLPPGNTIGGVATWERLCQTNGVGASGAGCHASREPFLRAHFAGSTRRPR
jgi:hypothetical protein